MTYLAHSAKNELPPQSYANHVEGVLRRAVQFAQTVDRYATKNKGRLLPLVLSSALWHDLGKLETENQIVLQSRSNQRKHLPINHVDAGCAHLLTLHQSWSALAVYSHHLGLPNKSEIQNTKLRDVKISARNHTDKVLDQLLKWHTEAMQEADTTKMGSEEGCHSAGKLCGDKSLFSRLLLSCLADADHTDTAEAYGQAYPDKSPELLPEERLKTLNQYVERLGGNDERSHLRQEMYISCRDAQNASGFTVCDSPVGSGKTTAIMAHLLKQAKLRKARRIFVVLPYTSIIQQNVEVYRRALVLPDEDPESVVAELHCKADFQKDSVRHLTSLWRAPIIVTTAVSFFETLASNCPATLRRMHELPGSVIFVDESHNALPLKLLPLAWRWMNILADEWSCYWVLASGSLVRFWNIPVWNDRIFSKTDNPKPNVTDLVPPGLRNRLVNYEQGRISFLWKKEPLTRKDLATFISKLPGPRLLVRNTVRNAAVLANDLAQKYGRKKVEHISTALTAEDREETIQKVRQRLQDKTDTDWILVATSCVEAGVDFSFRSGLREMSSLLSLLQTSGRVNRNGEFSDAEMWSFTLQDHSSLNKNPKLDSSKAVLHAYFATQTTISPELSTEALTKEIIRDDSEVEKMSELLSLENDMEFNEIEQNFHVIDDSNSAVAIIDQTLVSAIQGGYGDWKSVQRKSVSIRRNKDTKQGLHEIAPGVYQWCLGYDSFLGYMKGILDVDEVINNPIV